MNIKVKSTKVLKTGTNNYGEWKLVGVTTDEDVEYTTLAKEADIIGEGVTINISNMDENAKGQKSFKKFEFVHGAEANQGTPPQQEQVDKALGEARVTLNKPDPKSSGKNRSFALAYIKDIVVALINAQIIKEMTPDMYVEILKRADSWAEWLDK